MKNIPIYKAEANDGLSDQIKSNASISYASQLEKYVPDDKSIEKAKSYLGNHPSIAGLHDSDLYFVKSLFCSSNWNLNDDVFDIKEIWASRHTPTHKPTNIEHDENKIIGHMASVWAMDDDGKTLPETTSDDSLPSLFHLIVASVIYTKWEDPKLQAMATKLIKEIESGKKFVSMECMFSDFDYALQLTSGEWKTTARNEETAWMTKHLRCYGGSGQYDGQKIGRVLRNITYIGKGYVDKPANPGSVIFNDGTPFSFGTISDKTKQNILNGVSFSTEGSKSLIDSSEEKTMSDHFEQDNKELKTQNQTLKAEIDDLRDKFNSEGREKLQSMIDELKSDLEIKFSEASNKDKEIESLKSASDETKTEVETLTTANKELAEKIADTEESILKSDRITSLVDAGVDKTQAEEIVEVFSTVDDEQFKAILSKEKALIEAKSTETVISKSEKEEDDEKTDEDDDASANLDDQTLENTTVDSTKDLIAESNENTDTDAYDKLVAFVSATVGINNDEGEK